MTEPTCYAEGCLRKPFCKKLCSKHYQRLRKHGDINYCAVAWDIPERLERYTQLDVHGCLLWLGHVTPNGYALTKLNNKTVSAHKAVYEHFKGSVPAGLVVDHRCRVRHCLNVDHLQAVTPEENMENLGTAHKDSKSGVRGVWRHTTGNKWVARVQGTRGKFLGYFQTKEEASEAVLAYRNEHYTNNLQDRKHNEPSV